MKRKTIQFLLLLVLGSTMGSLFAQDKYIFTPVKELEITSVKDQSRSGTCWSFSSMGFLEIEALRESGMKVDLAPMHAVAQSYKDKGREYIRYHGFLNFAQGGAFADVLHVLKHHGVVPKAEMIGLNYGTKKHAHNELEAVAKGFLDGVLGEVRKSSSVTTAWTRAYDAIIDTYLGTPPTQFIYGGKQYTPKSFAEKLGLDADNYVSLTSYTHHPFYSRFVLEIPDNWRHSSSYNLPIEELMSVIDNAISKNYAIAWGSDVSEDGFTRDGLAVLIDVETASSRGSDQERWVGASPSDRRAIIKEMVQNPDTPEIEVTQEYRQKGFDGFSLTDDHGMVIYGIAKDQNGKKFYMVKNSWGETGNYNGIWYASESFVAGKTMNIVVHKNAIPTAIRQKLGI